MPKTPLPGSLSTLPQCHAHSGLVERVDGLARSLEHAEERGNKRMDQLDAKVSNIHGMLLKLTLYVAALLIALGTGAYTVAKALGIGG